MKKLLVLALIGIFALTGCSLTDKVAEQATEKLTEKALEAGTGADVDLEEGIISINTNGQVMNIGEDVELPSGFPSDVPVYSKASVVSSYSSDGSYSATLTSSQDFDTIKDYYQSEIESQGWTIDGTSNLNVGGKSTTFSATKDDRTLVVGIYAYEESDEVTVSLSVD